MLQTLFTTTIKRGKIPGAPPWFIWNASPNSGSYWSPNDPYHVHVGNDAHGLSVIPTDLFAIPPGSSTLMYVGSEQTRGIDTFVRVVSHECVHKRLRESIDAGARDNELDSSGKPVRDGLPDALETSATGLSPNLADSTRFGTNNNYASYADEEVFCRMSERNLFGNIEKDWADDGLNKGNPPPPNALQRTAPTSGLPDPLVWNYPSAIVP